MRALAMKARRPEVIDNAFVEANPDAARAIYSENKDFCDKLNDSMWALPSTLPTKKQVADWCRERAKEGARVIIVDPVTATRQDDKVWIEDAEFMDAIKKCSIDFNVSILVVTHAVKGGNAYPSLDSVRGGSAFGILAQTVVWIEKVKLEEYEVCTNSVVEPSDINRIVHILKARNSVDEYSQLGFYFDPESLQFIEGGGIVKTNKKRRPA